jgi:histidinol-phosphate aminotransferase
VFPEQVAGHLWKIKPSFNLNLAAQVAVRASLDDLPLLRERVACMVQERERMATELGAVPGLRVWPSDANFLLVEVLDKVATRLKEQLADRGIAVRFYAHPRLQRALRISVGLPEHTDALVAAVREWAEKR